jgi:hypothetical protein
MSSNSPVLNRNGTFVYLRFREMTSSSMTSGLTESPFLERKARVENTTCVSDG